MAKGRSSFRDRVSADAKRQKTGGFSYLRIPPDVQMFTVEPDDRVEVDFVPYEVTDPNHPDRDDELEIAVPKELWYKRPFRTHGNVGPNNVKIVCPKSVNNRCPICEYRKTKADNGASKEELRELNSSLRHLYAVIPRNHKKFKEEVHVWDISSFCFQDILNDELKDNEENGIFPDLEEGKTLRIRFSEESIGKTKFPKASRIDFEDRKKISEKILDDVPNLDEMLIVLSYDQVHAKFFEIDDKEGAEEATEKEERSSRRDKDEDEKEERSSRRRDRDEEKEEKEDKEERSSKRRDRDEDEEKEDKKERRGRSRDEDEDKEERRSRRDEGNGHDKDEERSSRSSKKSDKDDPECPHGHRFGIDTDKKKECDNCKIWEKCAEAKEKRA